MNVRNLMMAEYNADPNRVYLMGNSSGGSAVWNLGAKNPELWTAISPSAAPLEDANFPYEKLKTVPVLVVHGRQDHTVPMEDSLELTGCLGSAVIERLWLDKSFHIVTLDVERDTVIDAATRFLAQHAGWPPSA